MLTKKFESGIQKSKKEEEKN